MERNTPHPDMTARADEVRARATHRITLPGETFEALVHVDDYGPAELVKLVKSLGRSVGVVYDRDGNPKGRNAHLAPVVEDRREEAARAS